MPTIHIADDRCDACSTEGCLGCRDHRGEHAIVEARTVDGVSVTLCKAAAPCIRRAKAAGRWLP
jgi:hypothetical protein